MLLNSSCRAGQVDFQMMEVQHAPRRQKCLLCHQVGLYILLLGSFLLLFPTFSSAFILSQPSLSLLRVIVPSRSHHYFYSENKVLFALTNNNNVNNNDDAAKDPHNNNNDNNNTSVANLHVTIAGAGPAGLLLAHKLLQQPTNVAKVSIYESRPDPRSNSKAAQAGFAYALGLGIRGRSAIQSVDRELWQAVRNKGNECDRFRLHVGPLNVKLRDSTREQRRQKRRLKLFPRRHKKNNINNNDKMERVMEPSLLLFQADLCIALIEELERRYIKAPPNSVVNDDNDINNPNNEQTVAEEDRLSINFQSRVVECDLERKRIIVERNKNETILNPYDVLVGCDGVNSVVRNAIKNNAAPKFVADKQDLPGEFKVARLNMTPPKLDANAVALIIPKTGSCTSFVEPTVNGSCCILFAGRGGPDNPILSSNYYEGDTDNRTAFLVETLEESFPLLAGADLESVAEQLITQKAGLASSVTCNVYHYESSVAIAGDAAHATGGVSGQGVNSALMDSVALSDCIKEHYDPNDKERSLEAALLAYSQRQVPEGKALYDLSFGPKPTGFKKVIYTLRGFRDTILQGRFGIGWPPLQTLLTTSTEPFSSIRRKLDYYYDVPFPDSSSFNLSIASVYPSKKMVDELKKIQH